MRIVSAGLLIPLCLSKILAFLQHEATSLKKSIQISKRPFIVFHFAPAIAHKFWIAHVIFCFSRGERDNNQPIHMEINQQIMTMAFHDGQTHTNTMACWTFVSQSNDNPPFWSALPIFFCSHSINLISFRIVAISFAFTSRIFRISNFILDDNGQLCQLWELRSYCCQYWHRM